MFLKTLPTVMIMVLARGGEVEGFSTNEGFAGARHLVVSDKPLLPTHEDFSTNFDRREIVEKGLAFFSASALGIAMGSTPTPAWADVSDGNALPEGAAQFARVVRAKTDLMVSYDIVVAVYGSMWYNSTILIIFIAYVANFGIPGWVDSTKQNVQKRVQQGASEMDKAEWNSVGAFLRRVYGVSEDMKAIASGLDSTKKQRASELIDNLKKFSKAADAPTGTQNAPEFLSYAKKMISLLDEFLDLLSDVPAEI